MTLATDEHAVAGHASAAGVEAVKKDILNALFGDAAFMRGLEALTELCVYRNTHTHYYCLQWFHMLRYSRGKPIKDISDAKRHLLALLHKGRKTRESFHRWHNDQLNPSRGSMITQGRIIAPKRFAEYNKSRPDDTSDSCHQVAHVA